jgi:hypothetical protein
LFAQNLHQALQVVWSTGLRDFVDPKPDKQNEITPATPSRSGKRVVATEDLGTAERLSPLARTEVMLPKSNSRESSQENENRLGIAWLRAAAFERHRSRLVPASRLVLTIKTGRGDPFRHRRSSPPAGKWAGFIGGIPPSQGLSAMRLYRDDAGNSHFTRLFDNSAERGVQ